MKYLVFLLAVLLQPLWASEVLPPSPHGQLARRYLDAFNSGEDAIRTFWQKAPTGAPIDERIARYRHMKADLGSLTPVRLVADAPGSLQFIAKTASGEELSLTVVFAPDKPQIVGMRIEHAGMGSRPPAAGPPEDETKLLREVQSAIEEKAKAGKFSGTVLIAHGSDVLWQGAFGLANREARIPNEADTRFDVGSITKAFTKVAIGQLLEQGKLDLNAKVGAYLPDYPNQVVREQVTIGQLLEMRSGIGDFFGDKFLQAHKENIQTLRDYLPFFAAEPLQFPPGTQQKYSNGGYIVLGLIVEKVSGQSYYDYVQRNVFERSGMKDSAFDLRSGRSPKQAIGYTTTSEAGGEAAVALHSNLALLPARGSSAGSAQSAAADLLRFAEALGAGKLISAATIEKLDLHPDGMGIAGGAPGLNAALDTGVRGTGPTSYSIVVLSNLDPPSAEGLSEEIRDTMQRAK